MQIVLLILIMLLALWSLYLTYKVRKTTRAFDGLSRVKKGSLSEILTVLIKTHEASRKEFNELYREIERFDKEKTKYLQKIALVRFSPFGKSEYEQSFSLSLLDAVGSGIVITSIHTKNSSRLYSKNIVRGQSKIELSPEEKNAIQLAMKS